MCAGKPLKISGLLGAGQATVWDGTRETPVSLELLETPVAVGDYIIARAGIALWKVPPHEAARALELFDELATFVPEATPPAALSYAN